MNLLSLFRNRRHRRRCPKRARVRLEVEQLDTRCLMSTAGVSSGLAPLLEFEPNDTLDVAQQLSVANLTGEVVLLGTIGNGATGKADVDWSTFTLDQAAHVHLSVMGQYGAPSPILGLYNSDLYDFGDPFNSTGHRLMAQAEGGFDRNLAAGTYYLALSGKGNQYFHPFLAGSGNDGQGGDYQLTVHAADLGISVSDGPVVLAADPGPGDTLDHAPLLLRIDFNTSLDAGWISPGQTVRLIYNENGTFGDGTDQDVILGTSHFSTTAQELQLFPAVPLTAGFYKVILAGDSSAGQPVLLDPNGVALGTNAAHPFGQDYSFAFQVTGNEAQPTPNTATADDTPAFAHDLDSLTSDVLAQVTGVIGDDPAYDPNRPDPNLMNPSADVDMYHFQISGPGQYAFAAEVFARRIGSSLDPGVSLFRMDPVTGQLVFIDGNNNSQNSTLATNGTLPLHDDSVLFAGLTAGDYYVTVTSNYNTPTTVEGGQPGTNGIFDPNVSHSGQNGFSTGNYVLNLGIHPDNTAPEVMTANPTPDQTWSAPPIELVVGFSEKMNLQKLFFNAYEQASQDTVSAVYIEGAGGVRYFPRLETYDDATNQAHFLMLDGLANGEYRLHLSSALGLTDLAGNALVANDPSGEYVVSFTVAGPPRGAFGDPLCWVAQESNDALTSPQDLGTLFPHELQSGVTITRDFTGTANGVADTADYYQIQVLQSQGYSVNLSGSNLPAGVQVTITDLQGNPAPFNTPDGRALTVTLQPGTYLVQVDGWTPVQATQVVYQLQLELFGNPDNAPALTTGPAPALQLRLVNSNPTPPPPPQLVVPPSTGNGSSAPSSPGNGNIILVSHQTNAVTFPTVSLQGLASGPLGGVFTSNGPSTLASSERIAFRLPEAPPLAVVALLATTTESFDFGANVSETPIIGGANTPSDSDWGLRFLANIQQSWIIRSRERIADASNFLNEPRAIRAEAARSSFNSIAPSVENMASEFHESVEGPGQTHEQTDSANDVEPALNTVLGRMACWLVAVVGAGLTWVRHQNKASLEELEADRSENLKEVAL